MREQGVIKIKTLDDFMKNSKEKGNVTNTKLDTFVIDSSKNLFGEFARYPDNQILQMKFDNGATLNTSAKGLLVKGKELLVQDEGAFFRSVNNERSNLGKFIRKYGIPKIGIQVQTSLDERGFFKIVL